jgi:hypothetical protein
MKGAGWKQGNNKEVHWLQDYLHSDKKKEVE